MQNVTIVAPSKLVEQLKQKARRLKRDQGILHTEALDLVAKEVGFHHWKHFTESAVVTARTEQAYLHGLILAFNAGDVMDEWEKDACGFIMDSQAAYFCERDLRKVIPDWLEPEEENRPFKEVYADDLEEVIQDILGELIYYRYTGTKQFSSVADAVNTVRPCTFWPPVHAWLSGQYHDTSDLPATDENSNALGIRL